MYTCTCIYFLYLHIHSLFLDFQLSSQIPRLRGCYCKFLFLSKALYEILMGVKIVVKGKPSLRGTSSLILENHRTRVDWLFLMSYLCRFSDIKEFRISLKHPLKKFPGAGECYCLFVFSILIFTQLLSAPSVLKISKYTFFNSPMYNIR